MAVASHPQRESRVLTEVGGEGAPIMRHKSSSGTYKTEIGNSQFYSKHGILPIFDSNESLDSNKRASATLKMKQLTSQIFDGSRFPKLEECAHFHYDVVELSEVRVNLATEDQENLHYKYNSSESDQPTFYISVSCNTKTWIIKRTYENFRMLDKQLHKCIYDRKFSMLPEIPKGQAWIEEDVENLQERMNDYLVRFSQIADSMVNCGPILNWFEMDNRGNRLMVTNESAINTPAIAAAHVIKRYTARAPDEICFEVGDIISVIDMPPTEDTVWWRGKKGYEVGFFPSECVEIIGEKLPQSMAHKLPLTPPKPGSYTEFQGSYRSGRILRRRGKIISFLRMFFFTRPSKTSLKQSGIMKERVFGCDLGEHLLNTGQDVPLVLKCCTEIIEKHGIVDGIFRLSGVASNIQKLRCAFDENRIPELTEEEYLQDIHCISSLLKMYFRELPNPLLTYQLYDKFASAVQDEEDKLMLMFDVVQQLPPPHYRTSQFLFRHLSKVAAHGHDTGMHPKNLAIVWAPNLLRSKELESGCGAAALQGVGLQAVVTEFLILYADIIFSDKTPACMMGDKTGLKRTRPKSLAISTPTKLLSLEEARERVLTVVTSSPNQPQQHFIEVGGGPATLPDQYHTVIDFPGRKRSSSLKGKKSATNVDRISGSNWKSFFTKNRSTSAKKRKHSAPSNNNEDKQTTAITEEDICKHKIRSTKSEETISTSSDSDNKSADFGGYNFSSFQLGDIPKFSLELGEGVRKSKSLPPQSLEPADTSGVDASANSSSPDEDELHLRSSELGDMIIAAEAANIAKKTQHLTDMEEEMCMDFDRTSQCSRLSQSLPPITSGPRRSSIEMPESKSEIKLVEFAADPEICGATISRVSSISEIMARAFPNAATSSSIKKKTPSTKSPSTSPPMLKYSKTGTPPVSSRSFMKSTGSSSSSLSSPADTIDRGNKLLFHHSTGSLVSPESVHQKPSSGGGKLHATPSDDIFPMEMTESVEDFLVLRHLSTNSESGLISPSDGSTSSGVAAQPGSCKKGLRRTRSARMNRHKEDDPHRNLHRTPSAEMSSISRRSSDDLQSLGDAYIGPETEMEEVFTLSEPTIQNYLSLPPDAERALDDFDAGFISHHSFLTEDDSDVCSRHSRQQQQQQQRSRHSSNDEFRQDSMDSDGLKTPDLDIGDFVSEMRSIVEGSKLETEFSSSPELGDIQFDDDNDSLARTSNEDVVMADEKPVETYALTRAGSVDDEEDARMRRRNYDESSNESSPIHVAANIALPKTPDSSDEWKPWSYDDGGTLSPDFSKYDVQYRELKTEVEKYLSPSGDAADEDALNLPPIRKSQSYERAISGGDLESVYTPLTEDEGKRFSTEIRELQIIGETSSPEEKSLKSPAPSETSVAGEIIINYPPTPKVNSETSVISDDRKESQSIENDLKHASDLPVLRYSPEPSSEPSPEPSPESSAESSPLREPKTTPEILHYSPEPSPQASPVHQPKTEPHVLHYSPEPSLESSPVREAKTTPEILHYSPEPPLQEPKMEPRDVQPSHSSPIHGTKTDSGILHYSPEHSDILRYSPENCDVLHYSPEQSLNTSPIRGQEVEPEVLRFSPETNESSIHEYHPNTEQKQLTPSNIVNQLDIDDSKPELEAAPVTDETKLFNRTPSQIEPEVLHYSPEASPIPSPTEENIEIVNKPEDSDNTNKDDDLPIPTEAGPLSSARACVYSDDEESGQLHLTSVLSSLRRSSQQNTTAADFQQQQRQQHADDNNDNNIVQINSATNNETDTDNLHQSAPSTPTSPKNQPEFGESESQSIDAIGLTDSWECIDTTDFTVYQHDDDRKHFIDIHELPKPEELGLTVKVAEEENEVIIERPSPDSNNQLNLCDDSIDSDAKSRTEDRSSISPERRDASSPDERIPQPIKQPKQFRSNVRKPSDDRMCSSLEGRIGMFEKLKEPPRNKSYDDHDIKTSAVESTPVFSRNKSDLEPSSIAAKQQPIRSSHPYGSTAADVVQRPASDSVVREISPKPSKKVAPPPVSEKPKSIPSLVKSNMSPCRVRKSDTSVSYDHSTGDQVTSDNQSDDSLDRNSAAEVKRKKSIKLLMSHFEGGQSAEVETATENASSSSSPTAKIEKPTKTSQIPVPREKDKPRPAVFQKPKFVRLRSLSPETNSIVNNNTRLSTSPKSDIVSAASRHVRNTDIDDDSRVVMRHKPETNELEQEQQMQLQQQQQQRTVSVPVVAEKPKRPSLSRSRFTSSSLGASDELSNVRDRYSAGWGAAGGASQNTESIDEKRASKSPPSAVQSSAARCHGDGASSSNIPRLSRSTSMNDEKTTARLPAAAAAQQTRKDRASLTTRTRTSSHSYDQDDDVYEKLQESFRKRTSRTKFDDSEVVMVNSSRVMARFSDPKSPTASSAPAASIMSMSYPNDGAEEPEWAKAEDAEYDEPKIEPPASRPKLRFITTPREVPDSGGDENTASENTAESVEPVVPVETKKDDGSGVAGTAFGIKLRKTRKD
ncbi:uncharacterized protein LOC141907189 [Tubulanus polymorphus]|uniref:uncharacterized protein LOC141907189 n=1 Tax=Tubulanus polymorphus TaxID=672921 RepID=UPI003DA2CB13